MHLCLSAGGLNLLPNFPKKGCLTGLQLREGVAGKEGGNFFSGVAILQKIKLKSEIFSDKKFYKRKRIQTGKF